MYDRIKERKADIKMGAEVEEECLTVLITARSKGVM